MGKEQLLSAMRAREDLGQQIDAEAVYEAIVETLVDTLAAGETVTLRNFGTFKTTLRGAGKGRNPRTGEILDVPAARRVRFTPGRDLKETAQAIGAGSGLDWLDFKAFQAMVSGQLAEAREALKKHRPDRERLGVLYEDAAGRFREISFSGGLAWREMRKGFSAAFAELKEAFKRARERF